MNLGNMTDFIKAGVIAIIVFSIALAFEKYMEKKEKEKENSL